jgi:SagB-type dehydrogenase family enzyme
MDAGAVRDTLPSVTLPEPRAAGGISVESAMAERRSVREFEPGALTIAELSQLLWSAQGVTASGGLRTAPSAGALYPIELYVFAGEVEALPTGVYRYDPLSNKLHQTAGRDRRGELSVAALGQGWIADAPAILLITANYRRTAARYGARAERYVHIEVGHVAENVYLETGALGLGTTDVGAFEDAGVKRIASLPAHLEPVLLLPIGRRPLTAPTRF